MDVGDLRNSRRQVVSLRATNRFYLQKTMQFKAIVAICLPYLGIFKAVAASCG